MSEALNASCVHIRTHTDTWPNHATMGHRPKQSNASPSAITSTFLPTLLTRRFGALSTRGSVLFWTPPHDISTRSHHLPIFFVTSAATSSIDSALSFVKGLGMSYKPANIHTSHETSIPFHEVTCHLSYIVLAACC